MIQQRDLMIYMDWKKTMKIKKDTTMKSERDWNLLLIAVLAFVFCWVGIFTLIPLFIQYGINLEPSSTNILYDILR